MGGYRGVGLAVVLIASGCSTPESNTWDLATNRQLYRSPAFHANSTRPFRGYIAPLQDQRKPPEQPGGAMVAEFLSDEHWQRPVRGMVEEILREELENSGIYLGLTDTPTASDLIIEPALTSLHGAWERRAHPYYDGRTYAVVALHVRILGPADAAGKRPVWLDKEFRELVGSDFTQATPPNIQQLTGVALSRTMQKLLDGVYTADGREVREAATTQKSSQTDKGGKPEDR